MRFNSYRQNHQSFTLVELLLVVTIISLLFLALFPGYNLFFTRSRLDDMVESMLQMMAQAKTYAVTGYQLSGEKDEPFAIGIYIQKGSNEIILFSVPLSNLTGDDMLYRPEYTIKKVNMGDIYVRDVMVQQTIPNVVIVFLPPHGTSLVRSNELSSQAYEEVHVEVGIGLTNTTFKKGIYFNAVNGVIQYE